MSHTETDAPDDAAEESAQTDVMIWVDLEMTGLDTRVHTIVEIAVIATDADLTPLDAGIDLVIRLKMPTWTTSTPSCARCTSALGC